MLLIKHRCNILRLMKINWFAHRIINFTIIKIKEKKANQLKLGACKLSVLKILVKNKSSTFKFLQPATFESF